MNMKEMFNHLKGKILDNIVPILFTVVCIAGISVSGQSMTYIFTEIVARLGRNAILIASLLLPVLCGMGLNFSIVLGAMAGEIGLICILHWKINGIFGLLIATLIATVFAIFFGYLVGKVFNKTVGQEMITGMILGFFAVGVFDLVFIYMVGSVIPMVNPDIMLDSGIGLKNTLEFSKLTKSALDKFWKMPINTFLRYALIIGAFTLIAILLYKIIRKKQPLGTAIQSVWKQACIVAVIAWGVFLGTFNPGFKTAFTLVNIPMLTMLYIAFVCILTQFIIKTKLGQDIRTVGQSMQVATAAGINVKRTRMISVIISTVIASWGQVVFLQNMGTMNTYSSHEQVGTYAVAALLVGGASISKANMKHVFSGAVLFHILFFITPIACRKIFNDALIGEYLRVFFCYGVIAVSLALYAWRKASAAKMQLEMQRKV